MGANLYIMHVGRAIGTNLVRIYTFIVSVSIQSYIVDEDKGRKKKVI